MNNNFILVINYLIFVNGDLIKGFGEVIGGY